MKSNIKIENDKMVISVPSVKKPLLKWYSFLISMLCLLLTFYSPYFFGVLESNTILAILSPIISSGLFFLFFNAFVWLKKGYELLELEKKTGFLSYCKKGVFIFHKKTFELNKISFELRTKDSKIINPDTEDALAFGYGGGKILIRQGNKTFEVAISINDQQAQYILDQISFFLRKSDMPN